MTRLQTEDLKARQARATALVKCLEQGGERIQDEAIGFEKALHSVFSKANEL